MLNFKIIIDEDQKRIEEAKIEEEYQSRGLPNQGQVLGVKMSSMKATEKDGSGIIKESA